MSKIDLYMFKVVIMGESGVGKSSLIDRICDNVFSETIRSTAGINDRKKDMTILEKNISLRIWDTAGQEKYRGINRMYFRNASGAILVFDITKMASFEKLDDWLKDFQGEVEDGEIILVGNKSDLEAQREVSGDIAVKYALKHNMTYIETSAKSNTYVTEAFERLGRNILEKVLCGGKCAGPNPGSIRPSKEKTRESSGCCGKH